jgi:hypothetical protein
MFKKNLPKPYDQQDKRGCSADKPMSTSPKGLSYGFIEFKDSP